MRPALALPTEDREGKPIIFDSYDMTPVWTGQVESQRKAWFYFTKTELTPGAARVGPDKAVFDLRCDDGAEMDGLAVHRNAGWKGPECYLATVLRAFICLTICRNAATRS